jgi:protein-S-isoprenylcysteine O-methyltransferase Ste14
MGNPGVKRPAYIIGAAVVGVIALFVYFATRAPEGITPMDGETSTAIAWISLAVAALSLATAVVGLIQKLVELRAKSD